MLCLTQPHPPTHTLLTALHCTALHAHMNIEIYCRHIHTQALGGVYVWLDFGTAWSHVSSFVTSQLQASGEKKLSNQWSLLRQVCLCVWPCVYISQLHMWPSNALGWGNYSLSPPFSHPLSFPPSLRNLEDFEVTFGHYHPSSLLLPPFPSTPAHILHPSTSHPEAPTSTKDVRQWFHTDQMRQCVSSITGHREQ